MKKLSKDNPLNQADLDGDGIVTTEELDKHEDEDGLDEDPE